MKCEHCDKEHDGDYASGRFCSNRCARGFSTKGKRAEINEKVSDSLKGRNVGGIGFTKGHQLCTPEARERALATQRRNWETSVLECDFSELTTKKQRKFRLMYEQNQICDICGMTNEWNGSPIVFHLDHINGVHEDNNRDNVRLICPNCHSQTPTYAGRNQSEAGRLKNS
jgi:RNA polymerase subunit RPABC4/transcription elongation factor Spt4